MAAKLMMLAALVAVANAQRFTNPMENPDMYHGDIFVEGFAEDRNALPTRARRWSGGIIPYTIDFGLLYLKSMIQDAMKHIEDNTCIRFVPRARESGYIHIFSGEGCYSFWGMVGGQQPVSLGFGCAYVGTILHELLHAIGFDHEQNRSDRDQYLVIYYANIQKGAESQFRKLQPHQNWLINEFDYNSIMIYGETSFSKDGRSKTMAAVRPGVTFISPDQKRKLSRSDIVRINRLYECRA